MAPIPVVQPAPAPPAPRVLQAACHHEQQPRPQQPQQQQQQPPQQEQQPRPQQQQQPLASELQQPLQQVAAEVAPSGLAALQLYHRSDRSSQAIRQCIEEFEATGMGRPAGLALTSAACSDVLEALACVSRKPTEWLGDGDGPLHQALLRITDRRLRWGRSVRDEPLILLADRRLAPFGQLPEPRLELIRSFLIERSKSPAAKAGLLRLGASGLERKLDDRLDAYYKGLRASMVGENSIRADMDLLLRSTEGPPPPPLPPHAPASFNY